MEQNQSISGWLNRWLTAEGFQFDTAFDGEVMEIIIPDTDSRKLRIVVINQGEFIAFSMVTKTTVPRKRWSALYPLLSQANSELAFGAWVLDNEQECIAFRVAMPGKGAIYEAECLRQVMSYVARTVGTMESQFRGLAEDDVLSAWMAEPPTTHEIAIPPKDLQ